MKMTKIYLLLLPVLVIWGCGNFLEESSQDEIHPSQVTDLEQMLLGSAYEGCNFYACTDIFTDHYRSNGVTAPLNQEAHDKIKWLYTWNEYMFTDEGAGYYSCFWERPYTLILGCNLVLDNLDEVSGDDDLRESIRGEALVLRAWYYLHLVNFFGIAYNQGNPSENLGVPLKLESSVKIEYYSRNTVEEVYRQIEKDLLEGNRLLMKSNYHRDYFRMGHLAAKSILSRVYLYMEDWDKALAYADSVLLEKADLLDLNGLECRFSRSPSASVYQSTISNEIIWAREMEDSEIDFNFSKTATISPFTISHELIDSYAGATPEDLALKTVVDLRGCFYFCGLSMVNNSYVERRERVGKSYDPEYWGIRTAELYLNRAEAYAQKYVKEGNEMYRKAALDDLNHLRKYRYNHTYPYEEVNITDGRDLIEFCVEERWRELCGEANHRWCDIRRYGKSVTHILTEASGNTEYTKDMSRYALPIPKLILEQNPSLIQNK